MTKFSIFASRLNDYNRCTVMNYQTRNQTRNREQQDNIEQQKNSVEIQRNRKRNRLPEFDLNRSTIHTDPKLRKYQKPEESRMANQNANLDVGSQFIDLSATIRGNAQGSNLPHNQPQEVRVQGNLNQANISSENMDQSVREIVADEALVVQRTLEDKVRRMVQAEMAEIKKTVGDLAKVVQNLSRVTSANNQSSVTNNSNNNLRNENEESHLGNNVRTAPPNLNPGIQDRHSIRTPFHTVYNQTVPNNADATATPDLSIRKENRMASNNWDSFDFRQIRIDKLGIIFDNKSMSIDDFVFRLEHLKTHYNISDREVVRDFHLLVSDSVKDWYWSFIAAHGVTDWPVLRLALLSQYQIPCSNFEVMRDLVERKQQNNETVDMFFYAMGKIRSRLTQQIPEGDMIKILKRNVNLNLARIIYPLTVSSVEQLRMECNEAERNFPRREVKNMMPPQRMNRQINEICFDNNEHISSEHFSYQDSVEIDALRLNQQQQQKQLVICWNCKVAGHVFMECPVEQRSLFCYKCGKPNVTTPKCPNCQQKNSKIGVELAGESRQTEVPAVTKN